jgi:hypothetical protein
MKKIIIICQLIGLLATPTFAQSFAFFKDGVQLSDNAEITISKTTFDEISGDLTLESGLQVRNLSDKSIESVINQEIIESPGAGEITFCFFTCLSVNEDRSQSATFVAKSFYAGFHLYFYVLEGAYAKAKVKYEIFNKVSPRDKATLTITYIYDENSSGINHPTSEKFSMYQRGRDIIFNYSPESNVDQLEIYNTTGQRIYQCHLSRDVDTITLPIALSNGMYVYCVRNDKKVLSSQKMLVR